MREGPWKLLCDYDGGRPELYNIVEDESEHKNLAVFQPERVKSMTRKVVNWYHSMPSLKPDSLNNKE